MDLVLDMLARWVHILSSVALVGGLLFMRLAWAPSLSVLHEDARQAQQQSIRRVWSKVVMITSGLLILSGLFNAAMKAIRFELDAVYNGLLLVKILLALAIFAVAALLVGRSATAQKLQVKQDRWLEVTLFLSVLLICIAGYMKLMEFDRKVRNGVSEIRSPANLVVASPETTRPTTRDGEAGEVPTWKPMREGEAPTWEGESPAEPLRRTDVNPPFRSKERTRQV